ncbi:putative aliphatic sulfonates transport permease protein SsuC [compost metagenome]|jgi:NitT/TauT family transport system permease protein
MSTLTAKEAVRPPNNAPAGPGAAAQLAANLTPAAVLLLAVLAVWELLVRVLEVPVFVLPTPSSIAGVLVSRQGALLTASWVTGKEVLYGFAISTVVGAALALAIARYDSLGRALYPLMVLFQSVPKIALAPLFILWFGYDLMPKIALIVVIAFFPIALNMLVGLRAADPNLVALLRSVGASRNEILLRVQVPNALPYLMAGMKVAITLSVIGAIVGEFAGASAGLGYMIQFASTQMETALVFAALVQVSVLGVLFYYGVELLERRYITWSPNTRAG